MRRVVQVSIAVLLFAGCNAELDTTTTIGPIGTTRTTAGPTTTSIDAPEMAACKPGAPRVGFDLTYAAFFDAYRHSQTERVIELIGDGPVYDPWLDPSHNGRFVDIESWVTAGNNVTDRFYDGGYGFGEPFQIYSTRRNEILEQHGIEDLTVTLDLWVNQDCDLRIEVHSPIASPDPCILDDVFTEQDFEVCVGPFPPTAYQRSVWTGSEVFIFGGHSGAIDWNVKPSGFLFDPATGEITPVPEPPIDEGWAVHDVLWVDGRVLVVGKPLYQERITDYGPSILAFDPTSHEWSTVTIFPEERQAIGAVIPINGALIFAGGDQNGPDDQVWIYSLDTQQWRRLEEAQIPMVEEARGVWTGSLVILVGGYAGVDTSLYKAYDPVSDTWRDLAKPGPQYIEYHELYWTGEKLVVAPMHIYTEQDGVHNSSTLLVYDPTTDIWTETSENPAQPSIRGAVSWTGTELLFSGGFSSAWHPTTEGSAYDPATDTWRVLADSPLSARTDQSGTWTGERWVVIGGSMDGGTPGGASLSDGAIYDPATDSWKYLGG